MLASIRLGLRCLFFLALWAGASFGAILFQDNFDGETASLNANLSNWYIYRPGVDVVADNTYGIRCYGNAGNCVDLDGTYMQGVYMWSNSTFTFNAGFNYALTFRLSGNQRVLSDTDVLIVRLGNVSQTYSLAGSSPWTQYTINLTGDGSTGRIWFDQRGPNNAVGQFGDNIGIVLDTLVLDEAAISNGDSVLLAPNLNAALDTPEPGTVLLMLGGLGVLALRRRG